LQIFVNRYSLRWWSWLEMCKDFRINLWCSLHHFHEHVQQEEYRNICREVLYNLSCQNHLGNQEDDELPQFLYLCRQFSSRNLLFVSVPIKDYPYHYHHNIGKSY